VVTSLRNPEAPEIASIREHVREPRSWSARTMLVGAVAIVDVAVAAWAATLAADLALGPGRVLCVVLVALWCGCALFVSMHRPSEPLAVVMVAAVAPLALAMLGASLYARDDGTSMEAAARAFGVALLPATGMHLALSLPEGALRTRVRRGVALVGYAAALAVGALLYGDRPELPLRSVGVMALSLALAGVIGFADRCRRARAVDRARLQWAAWGAVVAGAVTVGAAVLNQLVSWPEPLLAIAVATTGLIPLSLALSASDQVAVRIDRLLVHTITTAGLFLLVGGAYLVIVLGLGRSPSASERTLLGLSMLAAAVAALLWVPARERLTDFANRRVYGERHAPDEVIRTFGARLTRALPLDELLLQLAESLQKTMALESAEVWTGSAGRLERAVSVPDRGPATLTLGPAEEPVVARAGVSGPGWAQVWLPDFVGGNPDAVMRIAPCTNSGAVLGLIVARRPEGAPHFTEADDQALADLGRQVGLALHNVRLDSALQESLEEVQRQAEELRASRSRIVAAGDEQRRRIERDLHDGAQQHLVALAVSVRLARAAADRDPEATKAMLDELGEDLQDAVQELRNLAHGIYPPVLMDRGLPAALETAAGRAALPTDVVTDGVGRYPQALEAAVYFCCLEALQNAGKHAGDGATATVTLHEENGRLTFAVADTGAGFDLAASQRAGRGFVNMSDRLGAVGGGFDVQSAPGRGTTISGWVPAERAAGS
jgi:signal transduction histidine kinase